MTSFKIVLIRWPRDSKQSANPEFRSVDEALCQQALPSAQSLPEEPGHAYRVCNDLGASYTGSHKVLYGSMVAW